MDNTSVYISLPNQVIEVFADNGIDLYSEIEKDLTSHNQDVSKGSWSLNFSKQDSGLRDTELIIIVSAVAVPIVASGIVRIIDALSRYKTRYQIYGIQPINTTDSKTVNQIASAQTFEKKALSHSDFENLAQAKTKETHTMKLSGLGIEFILEDKYE